MYRTNPTSSNSRVEREITQTEIRVSEILIETLGFGVEFEFEEYWYLHAGLVPVVAEADDDEALLLGEDRLVHRPSRVQMRQQIRHLLSPFSSFFVSKAGEQKPFL